MQISVRLAPVQDCFGSSTRLIGVASKVLRFRVRYQFSQSRCLSLILAMSSRVYLLFPPRGHDLRPPSVTVSIYASASNAIVFQSLAMRNAWVSLCTQSVPSFSFPPYPLRTASSRFPNTICFFGKCPPLIRMSTPDHKRPFVTNVISMLAHPVISRVRLY